MQAKLLLRHTLCRLQLLTKKDRNRSIHPCMYKKVAYILRSPNTCYILLEIRDYSGKLVCVPVHLLKVVLTEDFSGFAVVES